MATDKPEDAAPETERAQHAEQGSNTSGPGANEKLPEPSMGPACLVIVILMLAAGCAFCAFGSFFFFSDQAALAEKGVTRQLIPWVEQSNLRPDDKRQILESLRDTVEQVRQRTLTSRQLSRLKNALEDNPVLLWGTVEDVLLQAPQAGLSEVEQQAAQRVTQRLLHAAALRKLSRNDLEYTLAPCVRGRADGMGIEALSPLTAEQLKEFINRAEKITDGTEIPDEPYEKSLPEVFRGLLNDALSVK